MKYFLSLLLVGASLSAKADNIVNVASNAGNFNTLLKAAVEAGLANTLSEDGPFTIFAPTDSAFEKLPDEVIISLLKKENKELQRMLWLSNKWYNKKINRLYAELAKQSENCLKNKFYFFDYGNII